MNNYQKNKIKWYQKIYDKPTHWYKCQMNTLTTKIQTFGNYLILLLKDYVLI